MYFQGTMNTPFPLFRFKAYLAVYALTFAFCLSSGAAMAQSQVIGTINKKIDKKKNQLKKSAKAADNPKNGSGLINSPENGRIIPDYDPDTDAFQINYTSPGPKPDEPELPDNTVFIDTLDFLARSQSVKQRDQIRFAKGLLNRRPIFNNANTMYSKSHQLKEGVEVFGWHPFWMKNAYESYNFSLLTMVSYFSYQINAQDGYPLNSMQDWQETKIVDRAHEEGCRVLLSLSSFGKNNNTVFLANRQAQRNCINEAIGQVQSKGADGIHLEFEGIPEKSRMDFTNFILDLAFQLKAILPEARLCLSLPPLDFERVYDLPQLVNQVDFFIINGFEFYGNNTQKAGPISPLKGGQHWWQLGLETIYTEYQAAQLPPEKTLMAFGYYGAEWVTDGLQLPASSKKFLDYQMYRDIKRRRLTAVEEVESMSVYSAFRDRNNNYHQIWFEDTTSLAKKYEWVQAQKMAGVAIWALGYDNGYTELWELLANKFAQSKAQPVAKSSSYWRGMLFRVMRIARNPQVLIRNPRYLFSLFGLLTGTSLLGFFMLYRYGCRFKRSFNLGLKGGIAFLLLIMLALMIVVINNYNSTYLTAAGFLVGGFIIGAIVFLFISRRFLSERDLP